MKKKDIETVQFLLSSNLNNLPAKFLLHFKNLYLRVFELAFNLTPSKIMGIFEAEKHSTVENYPDKFNFGKTFE